MASRACARPRAGAAGTCTAFVLAAAGAGAPLGGPGPRLQCGRPPAGAPGAAPAGAPHADVPRQTVNKLCPICSRHRSGLRPQRASSPAGRLDPAAAAAPRAFLIAQACMDWHARFALARRTFCVGRVHAGNVLELELRDVVVDHHEALFGELHAVGQSKPVDIALGASRPGAQVPDSSRENVEGRRASPAKEMQALVLVGSPDFVMHQNSDQWRGVRRFRLSLTFARHFSVCWAPRQNHSGW